MRFQVAVPAILVKKKEFYEIAVIQRWPLSLVHRCDTNANDVDVERKRNERKIRRRS